VGNVKAIELKVGRGDVPVPLNIAVCELAGFWLLLSVTVIVPKMGPEALGEKVTLIVQVVLGARLLGQLLLSPKLVLAAMLLMASTMVPVLVSVTTCGALVVPGFCGVVKVRLLGETTAASVIPAPLRLTVCGALVVEMVTDNVPVRAPAAVGVKVTLITQFAPTAKEAVQLLVWEKSPLMLTTGLIAAFPVTATVTGCVELVVPTNCCPNGRLLGVTCAESCDCVCGCATFAAPPPVPPPQAVPIIRIRKAAIYLALAQNGQRLNLSGMTLGSISRSFTIASIPSPA
jgi:hypothetical protein